MTDLQQNLLTACFNKDIDANYESVQRYAAQFNIYNNMRISEIDDVVKQLAEIYKNQY